MRLDRRSGTCRLLFDHPGRMAGYGIEGIQPGSTGPDIVAEASSFAMPYAVAKALVHKSAGHDGAPRISGKDHRCITIRHHHLDVNKLGASGISGGFYSHVYSLFWVLRRICEVLVMVTMPDESRCSYTSSHTSSFTRRRTASSTRPAW
jgi:hypothetical protein